MVTALDVSSVIGLIAVVLATANICLGLLIAVRYSPQRTWPHARVNIFAIHNATAHLVLAAVVIHPLILLLASKPRWTLLDIAFPVWSPVQPIENTLGAAGLYLLVIVIVTSYFRRSLGRRRWKAFHFLVYAAAVCIFAHGILADPKLSDHPIDPLDGEKVLVEACLLIISLASCWAWRYRVRKRRLQEPLGTDEKPLVLIVPMLVCLVAAAACASTASAEPPPAPPIQIHRAEGAIRIDGDLSDPGWKTAATVSAFVEGQPGDNTPAKVKTIVYLTYDDRYFYIGVRCEDPDPQKIRAPYVERDNVIGTDDNVAIFLDTRNDHRTAMELRVNPRGIQADGIYNDAGGSSEDFSPDYFYETAAKIDSGGWSAEYAIPFSSLRYPDRPDQAWNILIWRNYPREFRYAFYSTPVPRNSNCLVCHATPIVGLTGLPHAGHLVTAPYVTGQQSENPTGPIGSPLERAPFRKEAGLDVKWTPAADNAVDMTINPDFSQVESDVAQITANQRFAVFFPEKRPFFLEGFDLFDTPLQVVYTRTITSPQWGARSTGKFLGSAYTVLVTGDRGGGLTVIPGPIGSFFARQDFKSIDTIARMRHDIGRSFIGAVLTDREIRGGGYNRVFGPDYQWWPTGTDSISGELLLSSTENPSRPDLSTAWNGAHSTSHAFHTSWDRKSERYVAGAFIVDVGKTFRADLGFLPQNGFRDTGGYFGLRFYPDNGFIRSIRPSVLVDRQADTSGNEIYRRSSPSIFLQGVKNLGIGMTWHASERYRVADRLLSENYADWYIQIDPSRRVPHVSLTGLTGQRIDFANGRVGTGGTLGLTTTVRPLDNLTFDANVSREWLDVRGRTLYSASVDRLKATYSFSAKSLVRIIGQFVSTDRNPSLYTFVTSAHDAGFQGSILYSYKINWQTVLYVGYGDNRVLTADNNLANLDRSLFLKVSYAIQR